MPNFLPDLSNERSVPGNTLMSDTLNTIKAFYIYVKNAYIYVKNSLEEVTKI